MKRRTDDDERPEPDFDLEELRMRFGLATDTPWQVVRDALLDAGESDPADEVAEWCSLPEPKSWITCDVLLTGDYGGAGSVGEANQRALKKELPEGEWYVESGHYFSNQLWLLDNDANRDTIHALEDNYPLVDEEEHSKVEMEWEQAAWDDYGWADLCRYCRKSDRHTDEWEDAIDALNDGQRFAFYREAMEAANAYPTHEYSGAALPLDRIVDEFFDVTEAYLRVQAGGFTHHPDQKMLPFPAPEYGGES